ncbi:hypothetical protein ASF92_04610 [Pedobacter sp. Leaf176]|nr:hypothetical protein ASF92_04610 [Pedobacter sp. Leaf176]
MKVLLPLQPGSEGAERIEKLGLRIREGLKKINYFIWRFKKDSYLCTPNGNEGKTKPERRMSKK